MTERRGARTPPEEGERRTLAGRYELGEVIGRGGMGTVYRARDLVLGRLVAVKTLPWLIADQDPNSVARFEREARAAAALNHPAVVAVYDTGVDASMHFIVMELVAGRSLEAVLREEGPIDPKRAAAIAEGVADALAAAHRAGIVHRDIKPANVMVAKDGSVKVLDFGIARARGAATLTGNSSVLGTAAYMSPEQVMGKPAEERSDIYALGCVLYALLVGHPPFTGEGAAAIMQQQANAEPRPPREENPRVPAELNALVLQMLAKAPDDRPRSATEVRNTLATLSGRRPAAPATKPTARVRATAPTRSLPAALAGAGAGAGARGAQVAGAAEPPPAGDEGAARRRAMVTAAIVALILVLGLIVLTSGSSSPRPAAGHPTRVRSTATVAARHSRPRTTGSAPRTTTTSTSAAASGTSTTGSTTTPSPTTVAAAGGALTALIAQDVHSGAMTPQAGQQLEGGLARVLGSWQTGNATDAQQQLAALTQSATQLEQSGQISSAAAPGVATALANLKAALASAAPAQQTPAPGPGQPPPPGHAHPGHGGGPPGQAKKSGGNGDSQGD